MKFQCDRCKTRYSIGDEKIRGKVLKIRCKNCSAVITVRESGAATTEKGSTVSPAPSEKVPNAPANGSARKGAAPAPAGTPAPSPVLEEAFQRAMSRLPTPSPAKDLPPPADDRGDDDHDGDDGAGAGLDARFGTSREDLDESTRMAPPPTGPLEDEWYVSVDGNQEGPFTLQEAQARVGQKQPEDEMFAWMEGFDDWLPVEQVPELASFIPRPPPRKSRPTMPPAIPSDAGLGRAAGASGGLAAAPAPAPALPPPPTDDGPLSLAALARADGGGSAPPEPGEPSLDFEIGEASRVVKLPMLIPPGASAGNAAPAAARTTGPRSAALPGMSSNGMAAARGSGGMPAVGQVLPADANAAAAVLQPTRRKSHAMVYLVGGGALLAIVGVLVVVLATSGGSASGSSAEGNTSNAFVEGFYNDPNGFGAIPGMPKRPGSDPVATNDPKNPTKPGTRPFVSKNPKTPTGIGGTDPGRQSTGIDLSDPSGGVGDRDASEVLDARQRYGGALQQCWERALKLNPDLKGRGVRLEVGLTITAAGRVTGVNVNGPAAEKDLRECVRQRVSAWGFKQARADFPTQFTLVFN
jgi:predicted Zn finger-like uncharacterized protein